jgi:hypothetical protein
MSAPPYGSIHQHTSAYVSIRTPLPFTLDMSAPQYVSAYSRPYARQALKEAVLIKSLKKALAWATNADRIAGNASHTRPDGSTYICIRQHTSAYVSIRQHASHTRADGSTRDTKPSHRRRSKRSDRCYSRSKVLLQRTTKSSAPPAASVFVL